MKQIEEAKEHINKKVVEKWKEKELENVDLQENNTDDGKKEVIEEEAKNDIKN